MKKKMNDTHEIIKQVSHLYTFWNRMRPRVPVQNQQRELISTWQILQKDNNEDLTKSPTNSLWHASKYKVHKLHQRYIEAVTVVEFMYLELQGMHLWWSLCTLCLFEREVSYHRWLGSLLLCS